MSEFRKGIIGGVVASAASDLITTYVLHTPISAWGHLGAVAILALIFFIVAP